jgi:hypothetical protein
MIYVSRMADFRGVDGGKSLFLPIFAQICLCERAEWALEPPSRHEKIMVSNRLGAFWPPRVYRQNWALARQTPVAARFFAAAARQNRRGDGHGVANARGLAYL